RVARRARPCPPMGRTGRARPCAPAPRGRAVARDLAAGVSDRPKVRLFAGIELPADVRTAIQVATASLRTTIPGFRWVPPENLHLTLVFLGWVEPGDVDAIRVSLDASIGAATPFVARLGALGRFPERGKARVLWVGFTSAADALADLAARA